MRGIVLLLVLLVLLVLVVSFDSVDKNKNKFPKSCLADQKYSPHLCFYFAAARDENIFLHEATFGSQRNTLC